MNDGFVPRPFIFEHCCANCKFAKKNGYPAYTYECGLKKHDEPLLGSHHCDVNLETESDHMNWFEKFKTF